MQSSWIMQDKLKTQNIAILLLDKKLIMLLVNRFHF